MEFALRKTFHYPEIPLRLKIRKSTAGPQLKVTSFLYESQEQLLYIGLSNGHIIQWKRKTQDQKSLFSNKEAELSVFSKASPHKGDVTVLVHEAGLFGGVIISGSADTTLKLWVKDSDPQQRGKYLCAQTIVEHNGTVLAIAVCSQVDLIASASTDKSIRLWRQEAGRELLLYPSYTCIQVLTDHLGGRQFEDSSLSLWICSLVWRSGDQLLLYAGDSEGVITIYKPDESASEAYQFRMDRKNDIVHRLTVNRLLLVTQENFVFSISFDQHLKGLDATDGTELVSIRNLNRCNFTTMRWDSNHHELMAADELGFLGIWNVYHEKPLHWGPLFTEPKKVVDLCILEEESRLIVCTETVVNVYDIIRGQRTHDIQGHEGPIIALYGQEPYQIQKLHSDENPRFISCSLDNTIRVWDLNEGTTKLLMKAGDREEITCMCYLEVSNLIATGLENGGILLWNPEVGAKYPIEDHAHTRHTNTITALCAAVFKDIEYLLSTGYDAQVCIYEICDRSWALRQVAKGAAGIPVIPAFRNSFYVLQHKKFTKAESGEEMLCIIYNPINATILVGGNSGEILIWAMQDILFTGFLQGHEDAVTCMALDQNYLFTGSDDKSIRVWELVNNTFLFSLDMHTSTVKGLMIIAQTGNLISCGSDGHLFVWNYMSRTVIKEVESVSELNCIGFLTHQNIILIGTEQHSIMTVNLPPALGNPKGQDNTVNRPKAHMEKIALRSGGEEIVLNDDTRSIDSEDLLEPLPDPTEEMLRELLIKERKEKA